MDAQITVNAHFQSGAPLHLWSMDHAATGNKSFTINQGYPGVTLFMTLEHARQIRDYLVTLCADWEPATTVLPCGHEVTVAIDGGEGVCACIEGLSQGSPDGEPPQAETDPFTFRESESTTEMRLNQEDEMEQARRTR